MGSSDGVTKFHQCGRLNRLEGGRPWLSSHVSSIPIGLTPNLLLIQLHQMTKRLKYTETHSLVRFGWSGGSGGGGNIALSNDCRRFERMSLFCFVNDSSQCNSISYRDVPFVVEFTFSYCLVSIAIVDEAASTNDKPSRPHSFLNLDNSYRQM